MCQQRGPAWLPAAAWLAAESPANGNGAEEQAGATTVPAQGASAGETVDDSNGIAAALEHVHLSTSRREQANGRSADASPSADAIPCQTPGGDNGAAKARPEPALASEPPGAQDLCSAMHALAMHRRRPPAWWLKGLGTCLVGNAMFAVQLSSDGVLQGALLHTHR